MITIYFVLPFHPFIMLMLAAYPSYLLIRAAWRALPVVGG